MFSTFKQRLLLGIYIFVILSIPVGAYLASQTQNIKSKASEGNTKVVRNTPKPTTSAAQELLDNSTNLIDLASPNPFPTSEETSEPSSPTIATSFGPTLSLKTTLEGRPANNQTTKLFVGIAAGTLNSNPKFLLSFTVDLGKDGTYNNLSLAGLTPGSQYTALLKGAAQIATSSAFIMSPTITSLNNGETLNLLSGDLNEDNTINAADYTIAQKALGATPSFSNWNENADLNKDGVINAFDLAIVQKNQGQTGASGTWTSPLPQSATPSASLDSSSAVGGYWIWIPK